MCANATSEMEAEGATSEGECKANIDSMMEMRSGVAWWSLLMVHSALALASWFVQSLFACPVC